MTLDREDLKRWYRDAMQRRLAELRDLRPGLRSGDPSAYDGVRAVAQALRGSGATFGFLGLSAVAGHVESAGDRDVWRRMEGLIEYVRGLSQDGEGGVSAEWLAVAAGAERVGTATFASLEGAWKAMAERFALSEEELARRSAEMFQLPPSDLGNPRRAALRLVPEALMRDDSVLPLAEDSETITVATADPTSPELEMELQRITGRRARFVVTPPGALTRALAAVLDRAEAPPVRARRSKEGHPAPKAQGPERVLIVDDEPSARLLARSVLEKGGYAVAEAGDGQEALDTLAKGEPVSLVVADLNMPRLDGLELIWEMRSAKGASHVPIIVVTGETDEILETKLIEEGADDYIRKPLDPRLFLARVAATIRRAEH